MAVFQRNLNPLDTADPVRCLREIEDYLRYMVERVEFSVSRGETVSAHLAEGLDALRDRLEGLEDTDRNTLGTLGLHLNVLETLALRVNALNERLEAVEQAIAQ